MNQEKLKQLQAQVRIGGKGTARRKKKVVHRTATTDDKKLQSSLKKLSVNNIPGIEEVNMIKDDGTVIHFNNPKVQASLAANTFAVTGHAENKQITEMLPGILNQLGAESLTHLKRLASNVTGGGAPNMEGAIEDDDDDEVPDLVENFDEPSKNEAATTDAIADVTDVTEVVPDVTEVVPEVVPDAPVEEKVAQIGDSAVDVTDVTEVVPEVVPDAPAEEKVTQIGDSAADVTDVTEVVPDGPAEEKVAQIDEQTAEKKEEQKEE